MNAQGGRESMDCMPSLFRRLALGPRLAPLGWLIWAGLAGATEGKPPEPSLQLWQYQVVHEAMHGPVLDTRKEALAWLAVNAKPDQTGAVPDKLLGYLAALLRDPDPYTNQEAAKVLGNLGAEGANYAKDVSALLNNSDPDTKRVAAKALAKLGAAGEAYAKDVAALLRDPSSPTRAAAAEALSSMGAAGQAYVKDIAALLYDPSSPTRGAAAEALGNMGAAGQAYAKGVAALLSEPNPFARKAAAEALGNMGAAGQPYVEGVAAMLGDPDLAARSVAARTLYKMGAAGAVYAKDIAALLHDPSSPTRAVAARSLSNMGAAGAVYAKDIVALLRDPSSPTRAAAAEALGNMGAAGAVYAKDIAALLRDPDPDPGVKWEAVEALGKMGNAGAVYAKDVASMLRDPNSFTVAAAAEALGNMGAAGAVYAKDIAPLLRDPSSPTRRVAAEALGSMGAAGAVYAKEVSALLRDPYVENKRVAADVLGNMGATGAVYTKDVAVLLRDRSSSRQVAEALAKFGKPRLTSEDLPARLACIEAALVRSDLGSFVRFQCYLLGPLAPEEQTLLSWLGDRPGNEFPRPEDLVVQDVRTKLGHFALVWPLLADLPVTRKSVAEQVHEFSRASAADFTLADIATLAAWIKRLNDAGYTAQAAGVHAAMSHVAFYDKLRLGIFVILGHLCLWAVLIWAYPRWPLVQSLFFWNPWARRFVGLGYVGLLITVVPALRRRLFMPFRDSLLPYGSLALFDASTYFPESEISEKAARYANGRQTASEALKDFRGQMVLEGESGLGKTTALLKIARNSPRIAVLLRASECGGGPVSAIQARLQGVAKDEAYLRSLIHAGAIDVFIDGLNETSPDIRAKIVRFVEESFKGNCMLTTQPMDWEPPRTARVLVMHPLRKEQVSEFLRQQWSAVKGHSIYPNEEEYWDAIVAYMEPILFLGEGDARLRVLSNPMEASLVADLIARGEQPDLLGLLKQRFQVMEADFRQQQNHPFPYKRFAEQVYAWRASGFPYFPSDGFTTEVAALVRQKLMVEREVAEKTSESVKTVRRWWFRHDKFMEYCLLDAFLNDHAERRKQHWRDEAFFGVYDLLALHLTDEEDQDLVAFLSEQAADHKRNDLLNRYTIARRVRRAMIPTDIPSGQ
ncbi:MAG: hypothetical protein C0449_00995 [Polaromonas sp.]|nr:hypothetical protein [Polaromonas sp.]